MSPADGDGFRSSTCRISRHKFFIKNMIMNKENLKYCLYYKGEENCPKKENSTFWGFWEMERMFWNNDSDFREKYEQEVLAYIAENSSLENFLTSDAPLQQKAFVLYAEDYLRTWSPNDVNMVFDYGCNR